MAQWHSPKCTRTILTHEIKLHERQDKLKVHRIILLSLFIFMYLINRKIFAGTVLVVNLWLHKMLKEYFPICKMVKIKSLPLTVKSFNGSLKPCSGLVLKPKKDPSFLSMKYLFLQFFICSPAKNHQ